MLRPREVRAGSAEVRDTHAAVRAVRNTQSAGQRSEGRAVESVLRPRSVGEQFGGVLRPRSVGEQFKGVLRPTGE